MTATEIAAAVKIGKPTAQSLLEKMKDLLS
jgi:hypothetical protein